MVIGRRSIPTVPIDSKQKNKKISSLKTMQEILQYVELDYMKPLTLVETEPHFNYSTFYFCRLFQNITGTNFNHYLNSIRTDKAEELIKTTTSSITNIALECGFNNIRTFNRVFKAIKCYTPYTLR